MNEYDNNNSVEDVQAVEQPMGWHCLGKDVYVRMLIIAGLFCVLFYSDLYRIVYRWLKDPSWSHGFLIPFFSLYFLNQHDEKIVRLKPSRNYLGLFLMVSFIVLYFLNISFLNFGYGNPILMIATLGAIILFLGGWALIKYTWLPVVYLIFAVPLPGRFYKELTIPMRQIAAKIASATLNLVPELQTTVNGVVIDIIYKGARIGDGLDVADACSGMRLLMAFLALGVAMAYLHYRPTWQRLVLLGSTIPIAILCNIIRVTTTCFIFILWDPKYAKGIYHDMLGMLMLPLAFGLYGLLAWFMLNLFEEEEEEKDATENVIISRRNRPDS